MYLQFNSIDRDIIDIEQVLFSNVHNEVMGRAIPFTIKIVTHRGLSCSIGYNSEEFRDSDYDMLRLKLLDLK